jgi:hypothetical protein
MRILTVAVGMLALLLPCASSRTQTDVTGLRGIARIAGQSRGLAGVDVHIAELRLASKTDTSGVFSFSAVPAGSWRIELRHVGFTPVDTTIIIGASERAPLTFALQPVQQLDTMNVSAGRSSTGIPEFEARRARGAGRFLTRDDLRANDERAFVDVLRSRLAGISFQSTAGGVRAYSPRQQAPGALNSRSQNRGSPCYTQVIVDRVPIFHQDNGAGPTEPPDLSLLLTRSFDAVEYYSEPSRTPPEFRSVGAVCGTLVFWSRRR